MLKAGEGASLFQKLPFRILIIGLSQNSRSLDGVALASAAKGEEFLNGNRATEAQIAALIGNAEAALP